MLTIEFSEFPELITPRLRLRALQPSDAAVVFRMRSNPEVMRYVGRPLHKDVSESLQLLETIQESYQKNESISWAVSFQDNAELLGIIGFWRMDKENHRAEIGYMLRQEYWRQGIMDEAMAAALDYCFNVLDFHSIEANTAPENEASGRILEKHGFVEEAYFRENFYFNGEFLDSRIYSKINPRH